MTGQLHPRDFAKQTLFLTQELVLDAATPGKDAKDRLIRNAKILREACEAWCSYCAWNVDQLMKEVYGEYKNSRSEKKEQADKLKRKKITCTIIR